MADASIREQLGISAEESPVNKEVTPKPSFRQSNKPNKGKKAPSLHNKIPVMPSLAQYNEDGVDHINIWERGNTEIGKFLAHGSHTPFHHPYFGLFNNIEAFWHYIRSEERDDRIRLMNNLSAKKFSENFNLIKVPNFYAVIMDANWFKIKEYPHKAALLKESTLPLEMYYIYRDNGVPIRPMFAAWALQGFEEIRKALKEDRDPDFKFLMRPVVDDIYDALIKKKVVSTPVEETPEVVETIIVEEKEREDIVELDAAPVTE